MNKLLERQIRKYLGNATPVSTEFRNLLRAISNSYDGFDQDRSLIERSLELSSKELVDMNEKLRKEAETEKEILNDLRIATESLKPVEAEQHAQWLTSKDEVVFLAESLTKLIGDRKLQEQKLIRLGYFPEANPNPVIQVDMKGTVMYLNPSAKAKFPDMYIGVNSHPFVKEIQTIIQSFQIGEKEHVTRELSIGGLTYKQTVSYIAKSNVVFIYSFDITEYKLTQEKLELRVKELEAKVAQVQQEQTSR